MKSILFSKNELSFVAKKVMRFLAFDYNRPMMNLWKKAQAYD
ncbi:MAG: hypothetical protein ACK5PQ_04625 [Alphaproteobacteria bacterium]